MKSAYGLKIPEPDYELTSVGPGTPGGDLLRRYWMPVCLSEDLKDLPKRIRLLGRGANCLSRRPGERGAVIFSLQSSWNVA